MPAPPATRTDRPAGCPWADAGMLPAGLAVDDYPSTMLLRLASAIQQEVTAPYVRKHNLTLAEWRILARLHDVSPVQLSTLCRVSFVDKAYVSRILRALQPRGLLRTRVDPGHARRLIVEITPAGRALARRIFPRARESQGRLLQVLAPAERDAFYGALKKLQAHLDAQVRGRERHETSELETPA